MLARPLAPLALGLLLLLVGPFAATATACIVDVTWESPTCAQVNVHAWEPPPGVRVCV